MKENLCYIFESKISADAHGDLIIINIRIRKDIKISSNVLLIFEIFPAQSKPKGLRCLPIKNLITN